MHQDRVGGEGGGQKGENDRDESHDGKNVAETLTLLHNRNYIGIHTSTCNICLLPRYMFCRRCHWQITTTVSLSF